MQKTYEEIYNKLLPVMQLIEETLRKTKAGRKPKISDAQIATLFILSYITNTPVLKLAQFLIHPKLKSYHIFRKTRIKRIYKILRYYMHSRVMAVIVLKLLRGKEIKLVVDGTLLPSASLSRARTQRIKRFAGKAFWGKRKRRLYSEHYKREVEFEELCYGVLVMVVCDTDGIVYDLWFHPASMNEVKSLKLRVSKGFWLRELLKRFELIGDKGYRHCEYVKVCESKEEKAHRQVVEGVFSWLKRFNYVSGWRKGITLLTYLYAYALGYSFFRKREVLSCA